MKTNEILKAFTNKFTNKFVTVREYINGHQTNHYRMKISGDCRVDNTGECVVRGGGLKGVVTSVDSLAQMTVSGEGVYTRGNGQWLHVTKLTSGIK